MTGIWYFRVMNANTMHRLGQECQPFRWDPPDVGLFKPEDVLIVSNGRYVPHLSERLYSRRLTCAH